MAYQVPSLDDMLGFLTALFKGLLPTRNVGSRFVFNWKLLKVIAGAVTDIHANVASAVKDVMPDTALDAALDRWLAIFSPGGSGLRKGATPSRKSSAGRVRGAVAATTVIGDLLVHRASGLSFQVNSNATIPVGGFVDVDILAIDKGSKTRLEAGEVLEYLSTPAGLKTQVELQLALDQDGFDSEQNGAARSRLLAALSSPTAGGNQSDYVGWALAQIGIAAAYCYPNRAGIGTVDVSALHAGTGTARILNPSEVTALQAVIALLAPAQVGGTGGSLRILTSIPQTANVEITLTPDGSPQYTFDWDDTAGPATVLSWTPATRTLQFSAARPSTMQAGHRLVFGGVATLQDGAPYVVEALAIAGDSVILQTAPTVAPANTDLVYAGGPLTQPVRDAILAHLNGDVLYADASGPLPGAIAESTTNLQILATGIGTANPSGVYGSWVGSLVRGTLQKIAMYTRGVRNQNVITPAADLDATDYAIPNDAQIGLLNPGYVLVRRG